MFYISRTEDPSLTFTSGTVPGQFSSLTIAARIVTQVSWP